jgi:long-chain acyl-CoA synthetase
MANALSQPAAGYRAAAALPEGSPRLERRVLDRARATGNVASLLEPLAKLRGTAVALAGGPGPELTYAALLERAARVAARLRAEGVRSGDHIAIFGRAQPLWGAAFFGALRAGAVAVPLDAGATIAEQRGVLAESGARYVLAARDARTRAAELAAHVPGLVVAAIDDWTERAAPGEDKPAPSRASDDPAVILYTSGTTGRPKGVAIGHRNLLAQLEAFDAGMPHLGETVLSFLPLSHLFELTVGLLGVLARGGRVVYCDEVTPSGIAAAMRRAAPEYMITVPLFLTALKAGIERGLVGRSLPSLLMRAALKVAARTPSLRARRILLHPLLRRLGGRLEHFIAGGAPLDRSVCEFFERLGIVVLEGYGMTEASPVIATNTPTAHRPGSVGRPLPGVEVRCDSKNEICVRGPNVMLGYCGDPEGTRAAVDAEGWLHTGDVGSLDADGFLWITGRLKELIVLPSGKKVQTEEVERVLLDTPAVKQGCVLGRPALAPGGAATEVCAVVVPSDTLRAAHADDAAELLQAVRRELNRTGAALSAYKRPTRLVLRLDDLPMTALRKVRRAEVSAWLDASPERAPC